MDLHLDHLLLFAVMPTWIKPLWMVGLGVVLAFAAFAGVVFLLQLAAPKVAAIARTTGKEAVLQPLFWVILGLGFFLLVVFVFIPYCTFGDDIKMLKDTSLTLIMLLSIGLALWTSSVSVAEEIEGRTAMTVLCKPIGRRQFILGKFLGVIGPVVILFIVLGAVFLCTVSYKVVYDARESCLPDPDWRQCLDEIEQILPGLVLALMEAVVLSAISVAISTRLSMLPNLVICAAIYVLGHLVPMLPDSAAGQFAMVTFVADLLSTIFPVLESFNIYGAISTGRPIPLNYLCWAGLYCVIYSTVAMLVALLLFEDRDLA